MNIAKLSTRALFTKICTRGFKYCVYNGYEDLPTNIKRDLDIAIDEKGLYELDDILFTIARKNNLVLLHKIRHDNKKVAYVLSPPHITEPERLQVDFFCEFSSRDFKGKKYERISLMDEQILLEGRLRYNYFYIPPPHKEFIMKLFRRILKEDLDDEKFAKLVELYTGEQDKCKAEIEKYFSAQSQLLIDTFEKKDISKLKANLKPLKQSLYKFKRTYFSLYNLFQLLNRAFFRIKYPVGMTVAFLGPDGCGKSTVVKKIMDILSLSFHGKQLFYWRPEFLKQPGVALKIREEQNTGINPNPHGHAPENVFKSLFRFSYYLLDFVIGYLFIVWPLKIKKYLCVFDRYYYDVLVDNFRYNFSLPKWLLRLPLKIIPKPDITIIIDVPADELLNRKRELSESELKRQRREFLNLTRIIPKAYIINNTRPIEEVIQEITGIILLNKSYQTYFSLSFEHSEDAEYYAKIKQIFNLKEDHKNGTMIGFPKEDAPRVFVSSGNFRIFRSSLPLYTPSRLVAKFLYKIIPPWILYTIIKRKSTNKFHIGDSLLLDRIKSIFPDMSSISIYTGAPGPHRKPLVEVIDKHGKILGYVKMGINAETYRLIENEEKTLNYIKILNLKSIYLPEIIENGIINDIHYLALKTIDFKFNKSYKITEAHRNFMMEIFNKTACDEFFRKTNIFVEINKRIEFLDGKIPYYWILRYKRILESYSDKKILTCFAHMDFTPWNAFLTPDNKLLLFDLEYGRENVFLADLFHFVIQSKVFSSKKIAKPQNILKNLEAQVTCFKNKKSTLSFNNWTDLLLIYLLEISSFYFTRNLRTGFIEKDLRLEITWSRLIDYLLNNYIAIDISKQRKI